MRREVVITGENTYDVAALEVYARMHPDDRRSRRLLEQVFGSDAAIELKTIAVVVAYFVGIMVVSFVNDVLGGVWLGIGLGYIAALMRHK